MEQTKKIEKGCVWIYKQIFVGFYQFYVYDSFLNARQKSQEKLKTHTC